ncbi:MAG TPA: patatin-like phospholipase family protein [Trinickia sp.]|jgi:NTE family protein|uniref:patatin-like phospholipase family protein n=1 Tax=Trinickia sp. TaxID=2571163 RepID=UPI002CAB4FD0|nr:patatin-like phospholipase family protein [Trinickia sp.]HTI18435.1 patatin-like phospholipase family protein [Trinickia sp.]
MLSTHRPDGERSSAVSALFRAPGWVFAASVDPEAGVTDPSVASNESGRGRPLLVDLALQGGGSHGAFTWGVLDRLLEESRLQIEGISGTSAGAMNAAVLVSGFEHGGREGARTALEHFWRRVSDAAVLSPFQRTPLDQISGRWTLDHSPIFLAMDMIARMVSPYDLNPTLVNPLHSILAESIDFDAVRSSRIGLFITATHVCTGQGHVFRNFELKPEVLLASACLPTLFKAVEIDGEPYWDGGYAGNPTITPLIRETNSVDTLIVQVNPIERPDAPRSARDIISRLNEVAFNAPLLKELRMIALLHKLADPGNDEGRRWATMRIHRIASPMMASLGYSSKLNAEWRFLTMLRDEGRRATQAFLDEHGGALGQRSSLDLDTLLDGILH